VANDFAELCVPSRLTVPPGGDLDGAIYTLLGGGFRVEPEHDGIRCQALLGGSGWAFAGKTPSSSARPEYANLASRLPAVPQALSAAAMPLGTLLDGKLVSESGWGSVLRWLTCAGGRLENTEEPRGVRLVVFDVLAFGSDPTDGWPLAERGRLLDGVATRAGAAVASPWRTGDEGLGFALDLLRELGKTTEGVVLKRLDAPYGAGGATKDWLVHRHREVRNGVVLDVVEGRGKLKGTAGSVVVGQRTADGVLRRVASLDGMTMDQRHYAWRNRRGLAGTVVSFASQGCTESGYRRPRLLCFVASGDPGSCLWEGGAT
jgi:bifunctional non-homologous end joining protein LigD